MQRGTAPSLLWAPRPPLATSVICNAPRTTRAVQTGGACMNVDHAPTALAASREPHGYARLHGRWRRLARGVWITLVACTLGVSFASLPVYLAQLLTPCAGSACGFQQLTPQQVAALAEMGVSLGAYAA